MEVFLTLLLLSVWTAQETLGRSLNNSGGMRMGPASEEESEIMHHSPGKEFVCDTSNENLKSDLKVPLYLFISYFQ